MENLLVKTRNKNTKFYPLERKKKETVCTFNFVKVNKNHILKPTSNIFHYSCSTIFLAYIYPKQMVMYLELRSLRGSQCLRIRYFKHIHG